MKKRLVSMFLCLVMVVGLFPVVAVAGSSDGYRIRTGSGLYAELSTMATRFGDTTAHAVAAVEQWLRNKEILNPEAMESEADKLSTPKEMARFALDNFYINVILSESIFNYAAQIDKADLKYSGDPSSMGEIFMTLFGISVILSLSQQELIDPIIEMRAGIFEALEKMFDGKASEAVEELRQMLRERAVYGGANDTYERLQFCMKSVCAVMGFDEDTTETMVDALDIWLADEDAKSIEAWQNRGKTNEISLNTEKAEFDEQTKIALAENIYVIIAEIMSFMDEMEWDSQDDMVDAYKTFVQKMAPMLYEYMLRVTELINEEKYLELVPVLEEMNQNLAEVFAVIFEKAESQEPAKKYQRMLQAGYEQIREEAAQEDHSGVIAGLALIAANSLLTRAIRVTAAATTLRTARTFAVPAVRAILLTGAVRTLRGFTAAFIPFAFR